MNIFCDFNLHYYVKESFKWIIVARIDETHIKQIQIEEQICCNCGKKRQRRWCDAGPRVIIG